MVDSLESLRLAPLTLPPAAPAKAGAVSLELLANVLRWMLRARFIDERLEKLQRQGRIGFHVGALGEEGAILGATAALKADDWIVPCYREFAALLYRGYPLERYLDNVYGNCDDVVQGRQMPDHVTSRALNYLSVSSPVGTQITQATGLAWAAKLKGERRVAAVFFGDGATSSNDFHAALTIAGVHKLPTLFLCRNNHFAISVPTDQQCAASSFAAKGEGYGVLGLKVDGNDVAAVISAVQAARARALAGDGPTLLELDTYRLGGHSTSDDPTRYRSQEEFEAFQAKDPVVRLRETLTQAGAWSEALEADALAQIKTELTQAVGRSEAKAKPPLSSVFHDVYAEMPWHLRAQWREAEAAADRSAEASSVKPEGGQDV